jgi:hypothetical protein
MIDKLKLTSNVGPTPEEIHKKLINLSSDTRSLLDRLYLWSRSYLINGKALVIKTQPKHSNISTICIETNPSHYEGLKELTNVISEVIDYNKLRITRMDHKADLLVSYSELKNKIDVKFKILKSDYHGSKPTGMNIGSGNQTICIYDKAIQSKLDHPLTRIEVREKFKSLKVSKLSELGNLLDNNPFSNIRIMDLSEATNSGSPKNYQRLKDGIQAKGLLITRKELSQSNNFNKTYERYLRKSPLNDLLLNTYKIELTKFLRN